MKYAPCPECGNGSVMLEGKSIAEVCSRCLSGSENLDPPNPGFVWRSSYSEEGKVQYAAYYKQCLASKRHPVSADEFYSEWRRCATPKQQDTSETIDGLKVSSIPPFHLIPRIAYQRLAERVALGEQTKGKDAWNAFSDNQEVLLSRKALARRLGHAIDHATKMLADLAAGRQTCLSDDDAAALCWAGMYAICASDAQQKKQDDNNPLSRCPNCRGITLASSVKEVCTHCTYESLVCQPTSSPSVSNNSKESRLSASKPPLAAVAVEGVLRLSRLLQVPIVVPFSTEEKKQEFLKEWQELQSQQDKSTNTNNSSPVTE